MSSDFEVKMPETSEPPGLISDMLTNVTYNPVIIILCLIICGLIYKIFRIRFPKSSSESAVPDLPKIRKDMTKAELRQYDGTQPDGRILVAVNGWIFDVTKRRRFYGPGGPYAAFGGNDATRGLATFSVTSNDKEYDDLSDLNSMEMESVKEWEEQFRENYDLVGRLLKPGEEPTNYSDEEAEDTDASTNQHTDTEGKKDK